MNLKRSYPTLIAIFLVAVLTFFALWIRKSTEDRELFALGLKTDKGIDITPMQIRSIERMGQWEFLAITDEELIDTLRHRTFRSDDRLARIYRGTLRLGIDLSQCAENWVDAHGDSVSLTLPPIILLSEHFIDEARTRSFYESGTWDARTHERMYQRAAKAMKQRCLTEENIQKAESNAREQFTSLFRSFGFNTVECHFTKTH